jgi:hypothetical protein
MEQLVEKFHELCVSMQQLTCHVRLLKNKMKFTSQDDFCSHLKLNILKCENDKYISEYLANIMDTPKYTCFTYGRLWFGYQVTYALTMFMKLLPEAYQADDFQKPVFICLGCHCKCLQEISWDVSLREQILNNTKDMNVVSLN